MTFKELMRYAALLLLLLFVGGAVRAAPASEAFTPPSREEIDAAVEKGVAFLKKEQAPDGSWGRDPGKTGLGVYALAHAGVPADDPGTARAVRHLRAGMARPENYEACLAIIALATLDPEAHAERIGRLAGLVAAAQCDNGQWSYRLRPGRAGGDNSNTQFAALALWYARQAGADVAPEVFRKTREFFERTQNEDGGWGYSEKERQKSYGSMVATGLAALVICRAGEDRVPAGDERARRGEAVAKALTWLGGNFAPDRNPEASFRLGGGRKEITDAFWRHYWLWSLERAATLAGVTELGGRDWYARGARRLLDTQRDDGSWVGSEAPFEATAFSVLFLARGTKKAVATEKERLRGTATPGPR